MGKSRIKFVLAACAALVGTLALAGVLSACSEIEGGVSKVESAKNVIGAVVPHHLLVSKDMDQFYEKLAAESDVTVEHVVIVSPNHFAYGFSFVQTTDVYPGLGADLNLELINKLNSFGAAKIEPTFFDKEHGVFAHFEFLARYFPDADITPIIIKRDAPKERIDVLAQILSAEIPDNTLIVASIDFTHFEPEEVAAKDDDRTLAWLEEWSARDADSKHRPEDFGEVMELAVATYQEKSGVPDTDPVAIDSPESFYVMTRMFGEFEFEKRTSSALILETTKPEENTTHIFGKLGL